MSIEIAGWVLDIDVKRTKATYAQIQKSGWETCGCQYCKNFGASLPDTFPKEIQDFFFKAGIDMSKDAEVYEYGEVSPGILHYGGEYYLWGKVIQEPDKENKLDSGFGICFTQPTPLAQEEFSAEGSLCFLFEAHIPWVLDK